MGLSLLSRITVAVLSILRVGLSTAIIIITAQQLYHVDFRLSKHGNLLAHRAQCLMAGDVRGKNVCDYTYAVCGLSMLLSLLTSIFLCVSCNMCGLGTWLEFAAEGFQTTWWIIAGIVISKKVRDSNELVLEGGQGLPKENWRNAVAVMIWVAALLSFLAALIYLAESIKGLARCCCRGDNSSHGGEHHRKRKGRETDKDQALPVDYGKGAHPGQSPAPQRIGGDKDVAVQANAV